MLILLSNVAIYRVKLFIRSSLIGIERAKLDNSTFFLCLDMLKPDGVATQTHRSPSERYNIWIDFSTLCFWANGLIFLTHRDSQAYRAHRHTEGKISSAAQLLRCLKWSFFLLFCTYAYIRWRTRVIIFFVILVKMFIIRSMLSWRTI